MLKPDLYLLGDCFDYFPQIAPGTVDMIFADLPYNTTANNYDKEKTDLAKLWIAYKNLLKPGGAAIFTAAQPFTSLLVCSNLDWFKYDIVWKKSQATGHLNARKMPMRQHESILVFGNGAITYNPQLTKKPPENIRPMSKIQETGSYGKQTGVKVRTIPLDMSYPSSIHCADNAHTKGDKLHPNQKPVALLEYLIKTYSNQGELILDSHAGVATTAIAARNTGRRYIAIEKDKTFYERGQRRLQEVHG